MLKTTLAGLRAHKLRLGLTAFSIVLGVAFVCATLSLSNALQTSFDSIINSQGTKVAVVVHGHNDPGGSNGGFSDATVPVPDSLLSTVSGVSGVSAAEGFIFRSGATPLNQSDKPLRVSNGAPQFLGSWLNTPEISPFPLRAGTPPTQPNDVDIDATTARIFNIKVGQSIDYVFNGGEKQKFVVSGIVGYGTSDTLNGAIISLFRIDVAQNEAGIPGHYDSIQVAADSGLTQSVLRDRIASQLPKYAEAQTEANVQGQQTQSIDSVFSIIRTVLLAFALVALFVGSYIIVNTFSILIRQRTRELALLRAMGATPGQVFRSVLLEALITGLLASAVGCAVSVLLAHGLYATLSTAGGAPKADLVLQGSTILIGVGLGTVITVIASILPARKASRVSPVEAIRDAGDTAQPLGRKRIVGSVISTFAGAGLMAIGLFTGISNAWIFLVAGILVVYLSVSSLAPLAVAPISGTLGRPIARFRGTPGKLARMNSIRAPRRAAATAAALMIGVSLVVGVAVLISSLKESTTVALQDSVLADYIVLANGSGARDGGINAATASNIAMDSHFSAVSDIKVGTILVGGSSTSVFAMDASNYQQLLRFDVTAGSSSSLGDANTIFVDQQTASDNHWKAGDIVPVTFPQKNITVNEHIGCIYAANALLTGYVISTSQYKQYFLEQGSTIILAKGAPSVSHGQGLAAINHDILRYPTLRAFDAAAFLALENKQFDSLNNTIDVFLLMAIIIASLGIVNTLALSIIERTRELGLLRAIGLTRSQTRTMIRWESVLIAFLGLVLGSILGIAMGAAVVKALASTGINHISIPFGSLVVYAIAALIVGLLAAILPARHASRINVLEAITME
jgi:putative ABC transport system permease protein